MPQTESNGFHDESSLAICAVTSWKIIVWNIIPTWKGSMARLATPISLGMSWPLTNPPGELRHLLSPECGSYSLLFEIGHSKCTVTNVETHDVDMKKKRCRYQVILCFTRDST